MKNRFLILLFLVLTISCNMSDSSEVLSEDYTYVHEGADYNFIFGKNEIYANVIDYKFDENYILACQIPNRRMYLSAFESHLSGIYTSYYGYLKDSTSEKFNRSRNEILADTLIPKIFKNKKVSFKNSLEDIQKGEEIADSIMKNNPFHKKVFSLKKVYWIIIVKKNILIGPLSENEYKIKRKELKISDEIQLSK